jgi:type IV secretory pathway TrbD component
MIARRVLLLGDIEDATTIAALEEVVFVAAVVSFGCNDWILRNGLVCRFIGMSMTTSMNLYDSQ